MGPVEPWRTSTARLLAVYGVFFALWSVFLIAVIQWDTSRYLSRVVDQILAQRARYLAAVERPRLPEAMAATVLSPSSATCLADPAVSYQLCTTSLRSRRSVRHWANAGAWL